MTDDKSTRAYDIGEMYAVLPSIDGASRGRGAIATRRPPPSGRTDRTRWRRCRLTRSAGSWPRHSGRARSTPADRMRILVTGAAGFIGRWVVGGASRAGSSGPAGRQPRHRRSREPRRFRGASRPASHSRSATSVTPRRVDAGPVRSTRSPTSPRRSRSRTRSTTRRRRSRTTSSARSICSRPPGRPGPVPVHEHLHGLRPLDAPIGDRRDSIRRSLRRRTPPQSWPARR